MATIWLFMFGGMKRELIPGRWQIAVEGLIAFVDDMVNVSIGPEGKKYLPWVFTLVRLPPVREPHRQHAVRHRLRGSSVHDHRAVHFTGIMSLITFAIVLGVGFWKHGLHFFSLFVPKDAPLAFKFVIAPIEFVSFLVRPFSLGLRPFIAMFAGHMLLDVFGNFVVQSLNSHSAGGIGIWLLSIPFIMFVSMIELLVAAIQAYVFAILTSLYISEAVNLH